jgi:hypothetical protein
MVAADTSSEGQGLRRISAPHRSCPEPRFRGGRARSPRIRTSVRGTGVGFEETRT